MKSERSKPIIIVLCIVILVFFSISIRSGLRLHRTNLVSIYRQEISQKIIQNHGSLTAKNSDIINSWMTFDYINKIFLLQRDYLKNTLNISDTHYPMISISRYEKNNKLNNSEFLPQVKKAVENYFINK